MVLLPPGMKTWLESEAYTEERPVAIDLETWIPLYLKLATQALKFSDPEIINPLLASADSNRVCNSC